MFYMLLKLNLSVGMVNVHGEKLTGYRKLFMSNYRFHEKEK